MTQPRYQELKGVHFLSQKGKLSRSLAIRLLYKGNELSGVQFGLKSYTWFQNQSAQREFDLKSQVWFQTKIAQHKVQLPPYYIHFEIVQIQDLVSSNILLMQYWAGLRLNSSIFFWGGGGGKRGLETKVAKFVTWYSLSFISCSLIQVTLNKPWNVIGCYVFSVACSLAGKKARFKAKKLCDSWINCTN